MQEPSNHQTNLQTFIGPEEGTPENNGTENTAVVQAVGNKPVRSRAPGIRVARRFTEPDEDVWNSVEWEKRTAIITGERGEVVFEQRDVEAPKTWTQLAVNVVASKYFRGHIGTPEREYSVKQMIRRVSYTMADWGKAMGYFASEADYLAFRDELTYILLHQKAAFNSPVWFNVGVAGLPKPQCSACFINSVQDTMESILTLAKTEGMLFKYGSGTGTNLSTLRSSREKLQGGGTASGPVSFMKGFDSFAGVIKSGGKTRRAAKMVLLNIDHPDIQQFITCKAEEEKKAWALIDAGYNGNFNVPGGAYDSVSYQNANHSVRVTDEFMRACLEDREWKTRYVLTGEVCETLRARDLMRQIAESAWLCGDPGLQYDTTINRWHTCKNTGRINASNPCCVTGDTLIAVADGRNAVPIRDLVGTEVPVYAYDHATGRTVISRMWNIGVKRHNAPIYRVTLDDGSHFRATDDHLILLRDGGYRMVRDLKPGDGLMPFHSKVLMAAAEHNALHSERMRGERYQRCCPVCRQNFETPREEQIFCSLTCRYSPIGIKMCGEKTWTKNRGRALSAEHRARLSASVRAASDPAAERRAAQAAHRNIILKAARLLLDNGAAVSLETWDALREEARRLGASRVPTATTVAKHFASDQALQEQAALYNHKVVSVEFCGYEDVYDGTVDTHHNFAILTSAEPACVENALNYSGIFIHNSEFVFLDDTACNLSSINLMKFRRPDGEFDVEGFQHACRIMITAQEIIVDNASYPTEAIAQNSHDYRPLGLGYANLGALLMSRGIAYDSDAGRALCAAITAVMTGEAYHQSAIIARDHGWPFPGYEKNREPMLEVMRMHRAAVENIDATHVPADLLAAARSAWDNAIAVGEKYGYRNAQATVLAPTGTISFLMDCDTTGIEPDIAIIKYKSLVGGGMMKIVNNTVPEALERLGYTPHQVQEILAYINERDTIEGAPHLKEEHLPIFDCAFKPANGTRSIHYMGHVRMMAAAQPFISGAISKTVNMPNEATVEDIMNVYVEGWKLGLKAIAIYRDGSKRTQPLMTKKTEGEKGKQGEGEKTALTPVVEYRPVRRKLPDERKSITHKFSVAGHEGYITVGMYDDGTPGEIFLTMSKEGSTISGLMDTIATMTSLALQYGVPLETLVNKFAHTRFEPSGITPNPDIRFAKSIADYIFRWLGLKFLPKEAQPPAEEKSLNGGHLPEAEGLPALPASAAAAQPASQAQPTSFTDREREIFELQADAPACAECGALMVRNGACYKCLNCGSVFGCS